MGGVVGGDVICRDVVGGECGGLARLVSTVLGDAGGSVYLPTS